MFKKLAAFVIAFIVNAAVASIDINKASEAELDGLSGIGPATTQIIMNERKKSSFKDWDDVKNRVKGIGETRATKLSDAGLTVNGMGYKKKSPKTSPHNSTIKDKTTNKEVMSPAAVNPQFKKSPASNPLEIKR